MADERKTKLRPEKADLRQKPIRRTHYRVLPGKSSEASCDSSTCYRRCESRRKKAETKTVSLLKKHRRDARRPQRKQAAEAQRSKLLSSRSRLRPHLGFGNRFAKGWAGVPCSARGDPRASRRSLKVAKNLNCSKVTLTPTRKPLPSQVDTCQASLPSLGSSAGRLKVFCDGLPWKAKGARTLGKE